MVVMDGLAAGGVAAVCMKTAEAAAINGRKVRIMAVVPRSLPFIIQAPALRRGTPRLSAGADRGGECCAAGGAAPDSRRARCRCISLRTADEMRLGLGL